MRRILIGALLVALVIFSAAATRNPGTFGVGSGGAAYQPSILLPDTVLVAVGRELNVWYDAMSPRIFGTAPTGWLAYADSGRALDRSYRWTPAVVETATLTIKPLDVNGIPGAAATAIVQAIAKDAGAITDNILFIGDSLLMAAADSSSDNACLAAVDSLFEADTAAGDLVFIGTQGTSQPGEGRSGYTTARFVSSKAATGFYNPFWDVTNGRVSFRYYTTTRSLGSPIGYGVIMLGWNDIAAIGGADATAAQINTIVANLDTLVSVLKDPTGYRGWPDCRVYVCTIPMGALSIAAFGDDYTAAPTYKDDWPYWQRNAARLNKAIIERFDDDGTYTDPYGQVDVIPVHLWVDRTYGYPYSALQVSARNSATALQHTNYLHPNGTGQDQEADAMYSVLRHGFAMPNPINLALKTEWFGDAAWSATGSPGWDGFQDVVVADADSACFQEWTYTTNTVTYFMQALTGVTIQEENTLSCYFRPATANAYVQIWIDSNAASSHDRYIRAVIGPNGTWANIFAASQPAIGDSTYLWGRCAHVGGNLFRLSMSFPDDYTSSDSDLGETIDAIRVYINTSTSITGQAVTVGGVQFEQGTLRPTVYCPKP